MNILCWKLCMILFYKVRILKGTVIQAFPYFTKRNINIESKFSFYAHLDSPRVLLFALIFFSKQLNNFTDFSNTIWRNSIVRVIRENLFTYGLIYLSELLFQAGHWLHLNTYKEEELSSSIVRFSSLVIPLYRAPYQSIWKNYKNGSF